MAKMRGILIAVCGLLVLAGCGKPVEGPNPSDGYKLYEAASTRSESIVAVIDSRSHSVDRKLPLGAPSLDWKHIYSVSYRTLVDVDPQTGATLHSLRLPSSLLLPPATSSGMPGGLSRNGRWLVLQGFNDIPDGPPTVTHLLLVDTTYAKAPVPIELPGFFEFDAVSNDGMRVFLIQYVSGSIYHVRFYDVGRRRLDPNIVFDKSDGTDAMTGVRLSGVASPDGRWLFSVYARENASPFVHALDLDSAVAFCIDLPGSGYSGSGDDPLRWSLALSANGTRLYAANGALGVITEISNLPDAIPSIVHTYQLGKASASAGGLIQDVEAKEMGLGGAVLTPDGKTLVVTGSSGVVWVDTASMRSARHELDNWRVWGLALSPDGKVLYAVNDAGMIAELPMAGGAGTRFTGAPGQPLALIRVEAVSASP
ncbi:MAG: hypothetical protein E6J18_09235 [Chloroflexi bacterium]|nr:MAG: hypothetical protein E6J18_09235 [Chloroflexota bacterium]